MPTVRGGAAKWKQRTAAAASDYAAGVKNPRRDWAEATAGAETAWNQGVQQAVAAGRFKRGVMKAGSPTWQKGAIEKGVTRFASGVVASGDKYEAGFAPYKQVIESTTLPARGPKGDVSNYMRSQVIGEALHKAKMTNSG